MAYIGKQPVVGNFQILDAISVVNGQAAYTMQVASTNVSPESANHMLVSLNGVLQKPGSSFTVSGATITFASNLVTNDVIDFIILLGDALNLGTPSDATVTTAKLAADAVTEAKIADDAVESEHLNNNIISGQTALGATPADTDELLVSDAGTLKRVDFSYLKGGGMWEFVTSTNVTSATAAVEFVDNLSTDFIDFCVVIENAHPATDEARMYLRVYTGGGTGTLHDGGVYHYAEIMRDDSTVTDHNTSADHMRVSNQIGSAATESMCSEVVIFNPHSTTYHKLIKAHTAIQGSDTGRTGIDNWAGKYAATTAITGLRFFMQSGNIEAGRFSLYGRKHS
tara:strand:+ start:1518 stop:2534 length:1017 start_codon:yes stop_codon:yes gene_type:complete